MRKTKKNRKTRKTRYGLPIKQSVVETASTDANITPYGGKRYRTELRKGEFTHPAGTRPKAVILDIDGTLQDWGSSTGKAMAFARKHHDAGHVLIVVTARDHEYSYDSSFNWLLHNLPYPFIGPFMRSVDDPRYASEFKREVMESLEAFYEIVGAADDNPYVLAMYKHVAADRSDFDLCECSYTDYATWRKELPSKGSRGYYNTTASASPSGRIYYGGVMNRAPEGATSYNTKLERYERWDSTVHAYVEVESTPAQGETAYDQWEYDEHIAKRLDLEDDVLVSYPELTYHDVEGMDTDVLRQMLTETIAGDPLDETGPLDVEEILGELVAGKDEVA